MRLSMQINIWLAVLLLAVPKLSAAERPDFSGTYELTGAKGRFKFTDQTKWTLSVVQAEGFIEVIKVQDGTQSTNKFPLDRTEGIYISPGGMQGKCKGQIKGKSLILESVVKASVTLHIKERWELSPDLKKLTIRTDVENPQLPISVIDPWSEIYTRK